MSQESDDNFNVVLARLHVSGIRLQHTNFVLKEYANEYLNSSTFLSRSPTPSEIEQINKKIFRDVVSLTALFERLVFNLYNLVETHKELEKYLITKGLDKTESALTDCWNKIRSNEELIRRWRSQILAHGVTWDKEEIFAITEITSDTFKAQQEIYLCSGYAVIYIQGILKNTKEYEEVLRIIQKKHSNILQLNYKDYLATQPKVKDMLDKITIKLKEEGLQSDILLDMK